LTSDGTYTYEYDEEGNIIHRWVTQDPGDRTFYTWDHRNRLTRVSEWIGDHVALIVDYRYDVAPTQELGQIGRELRGAGGDGKTELYSPCIGNNAPNSSEPGLNETFGSGDQSAFLNWLWIKSHLKTHLVQSSLLKTQNRVFLVC
jgi:hypothetical protein